MPQDSNWVPQMTPYYTGRIKIKPKTYRGLWWVADKPDVKKSGRLKIRNGFMPYLEVDHWQEVGSSLKKEDVGLIFGVTHDDIPFSLFRCRHHGTETYNTRTGRSAYSPDIVVWGGHHSDLNAVLFNRVVVSCKELLEIDRIGRHVEHRTNDLKQSEIVVPANRKIIAPVDCGNLGTLLLEESWMESGDNDGGWRVRPEITATISRTDGYSISNVLDIIFRVSLSIRFVCCRQPRLKIIEMWQDGATKSHPCGVIINQSEKLNESHEFRFYCPRLPDGAPLIEKAISSIFRENDNNLLALSQFHYAIDNSSSVIEYRFFDMARVFENINNDKKIFPPSQHRKAVASIIDNIIPGVTEEYLNRIKEQLAHANEPSFRSKIESFILTDSQADDLCPDQSIKSEFIARLVKGRNAFAHLGDSYGGLQWNDIERLARLIDLRFWRIFGCHEIEPGRRYGEWASRESMKRYKNAQERQIADIKNPVPLEPQVPETSPTIPDSP